MNTDRHKSAGVTKRVRDAFQRNLCSSVSICGFRVLTLVRAVAILALYFLGGLIGKETAFFSGSVFLVWPPAGIALAAILLFGYRFWPGVALGAVLFSFMNGMPLGFFTLGTAIGNTMGAIVCAYLLERFV